MTSTDRSAALDDARLLDAWEDCRRLARPWREIGLLAASDGGTPEQLALLPLGERDRRLLALRARLFGDRLDCETRCPACGERLELTLDVRDLRDATAEAVASELVLGDGAYVVRLRSPDSVDIATCQVSADPADALVARCVTIADRSGVAIESAEWPPLVRDAIDVHLAAMDPGAELLLDMTCPACAYAWQSAFDPAAFLLRELEIRARQLLDEVHALARAYGWREAEILAMRSTRRRHYLERVLQ